jgi:hypothetical protein
MIRELQYSRSDVVLAHFPAYLSLYQILYDNPYIHTYISVHNTFDVHIFMITSFSAAIIRQYKLMQKMAEADHGRY